MSFFLPVLQFLIKKGLEKMRLTDEQIKKARQTNLVDFFTNRGIELKRVGRNEYEHPDHDSLIIHDGNYFNWFSRSIQGSKNPISLVMELYGWDFQTAVEELTNDDGYTHRHNSTKENISADSEIEEADNQRRAIAYLVQKRKIDYEIVKDLIKQGKLIQDTKGNACFIRENGSAEIHGTADKRYKGQIGRQMNYGFELQIDDDIQYIVYTESSIDLLSLYQLYREKLEDTSLISMSGLKSNVVRHYINAYPKAKHILAIDNDNAADDFYTELKQEFPQIRRRKPSNGKDWNEQLTAAERKA